MEKYTKYPPTTIDKLPPIKEFSLEKGGNESIEITSTSGQTIGKIFEISGQIIFLDTTTGIYKKLINLNSEALSAKNGSKFIVNVSENDNYFNIILSCNRGLDFRFREKKHNLFSLGEEGSFESPDKNTAIITETGESRIRINSASEPKFEFFISVNQDGAVYDQQEGTKLIAVADGVGSHSSNNGNRSWGPEFGVHFTLEAVTDAFRKNIPLEHWPQIATTNHQKNGFRTEKTATTLTIAKIMQKHDKTFSVEFLLAGDSPAYLIDPVSGEIKFASYSNTDSSRPEFGKSGILDDSINGSGLERWIEQNGQIIKVTRPAKNVVANYGDIVLLCTDGLTTFVSDYEISKIIQKNQIRPLGEIAKLLKNLAIKRQKQEWFSIETGKNEIESVFNQKGGDNITIALARVADIKTNPFRDSEPTKERTTSPELLAAIREGVARETGQFFIKKNP